MKTPFSVKLSVDPFGNKPLSESTASVKSSANKEPPTQPTASATTKAVARVARL